MINFTADNQWKYEVSMKWALTRGAQVTAQFVMYRKNCPAKSRTPLRVHEVEPLLCDEEEEDEEVELTALQGADMAPGRRGGPLSGDETAQSGQTEVLLKRQEAEMWHQQEVCDDFLPTVGGAVFSAGRLQPMVCNNQWTSDMTQHPPVTPGTELSSDSTLHVVTPTQPTPRSNTWHLEPLCLPLLPTNADLM